MNVQMDLTETGVVLQNLYGWPDWTVEVDMDWRTWSAGDVRAIPPPGTRRNARRPTDDLELVRRIKMTAEASQEAPRSSIWLASLALPTPHGKKPDGVRLRAETFSIMYRYAVRLGLSPKRAIHAVYGLKLVEAPNERALPHRTYERWKAQARNTINPATGRPYLPEFDLERDGPRRWPIGRHPLEPRKAPPAVPKPVREGPYAGRTLRLTVTRTPPPACAVREAHEGRHIIGPDLVIEGRWTKGKEQVPELPLLQALSPIETVRRVQSLVKELEERYPGAEVTATVTNRTA
ncbi:hypothetical protein Strvi_4677 [Streptomyces violaceusniger Tu 4113]|uniref:Uncharacterized protein n=2 Tax=Streptomyces violaceusniger TaxID=68280 RepID=G2PFB7_STRV4|nr:hypothetical protein Strvi_4677 [Streptomyces violaceusniger Tu 4113]